MKYMLGEYSFAASSLFMTGAWRGTWRMTLKLALIVRLLLTSIDIPIKF